MRKYCVEGLAVTREEIFAVGQQVVWGPGASLDFHIGRLRREIGEGPFSVVGIEEVPTDCTCDCAIGHKSGCGFYRKESFGHSQWVTIETTSGNVRLVGKNFSLQDKEAT